MDPRPRSWELDRWGGEESERGIELKQLRLKPLSRNGRVTIGMSSSILPTVSPDAIRTILVPKRYWKFILYFLCVLGILTTLSLFYDLGWDDVQTVRNWSPFKQGPPYDVNTSAANLTGSPDYPPDYAEWHKLEKALPQHNQNLSFPEGKEGRYVYFSEHVKSASIRILISVLSLGIRGN